MRLPTPRRGPRPGSIGPQPWAAGAAALAFAGCAGPQSALDPAGPAARAIADTWWLLFGGATAVLVLVTVLALYAALRRAARPLERPERLIVAGGLVFPTTVLVALLAYGTSVGRTVMGLDAPADLIVEVVGRQWSWQVRYPGAADGADALAIGELALPAGRNVEFRVGSADVIHSFWIPRLGGKIDAIPGRINTLRLRADAPGRMRGQCAEFCGLQHALMTLEVIALPEAQFREWLAERRVER